MDFFGRVKELTKKNTAFTLRGFIESLGINYETYYSGRRLNNLPRADEAVKIAGALKTSVEYLVTGMQYTAFSNDTNHVELIELYDGAAEGARQSALDLLRASYEREKSASRAAGA